MVTDLAAFAKRHEYLICVDSDGCAMDTMNCKHLQCFGPCMVAEFGLEPWRDALLARWNEINLYSMTRGINRFKALALLLGEEDASLCRIPDADALRRWADTAPELSERAAEEMYRQTGKEIFARALAWSRAVNRAIAALPKTAVGAFPGAAQALRAAHAGADVAVVSSANREAVAEEWQRCGLAESVDVILCQDVGSKKACIAALQKKGYAPDHILMVGDAPGDRKAAFDNGAYFYPILVRHEPESWQTFEHQAAPLFLSGGYGTQQAAYSSQFEENLKMGGKE